MKESKMGDLRWNLTDDDIAKLYPDLKSEERAAAAEAFSRYLKVVGKIYDRLEKDGKLKDTLLRIEYEKRKNSCVAK